MNVHMTHWDNGKVTVSVLFVLTQTGVLYKDAFNKIIRSSSIGLLVRIVLIRTGS